MSPDAPEPVLAPATVIEPDAGDQPYAWLTTIGRRSGEPRTVELWFVLDRRTVHFLAGGGEGAQWVRNADAQPAVRLRLGQRTYEGRVRRPEPGSIEDATARRRMATKYQGWRDGRPLSGWAREALCIAVDLAATTLTSEKPGGDDAGEAGERGTGRLAAT
jgi:deazaflavin-dependent oxidoreductase (nitroreductase family)